MKCENNNDNKECLIAFGLCSKHPISLEEALEKVKEK